MMLPNMSGKIAVVTGGSSGIGAAIVNRFLEKGATVISLDLVKPTNQNQQAIHLKNLFHWLLQILKRIMVR